jgi:hypothetical protein
MGTKEVVPMRQTEVLQEVRKMMYEVMNLTEQYREKYDG